MSGMDIDEFLSHSPGGKTAYMDWRSEGRAVVWLHPAANVHSFYFHNWPTLAKDKDGDDVFRARRTNCPEDHKTIEKLYSRDKDGNRDHPPQICPICIMMEWIEQKVRAEKLSWVEPIFRFGRGRDAVVMHAGGIIGLFGSQKLTAEEKRELKESGIAVKESFKERLAPQLNYIFTTIDNSSPSDGAKIAIEPKALGKAMQKAIASRIDDLGKEKGNPKLNPVAFRWLYDKDADINERYAVSVRTSEEMTPEIRAAMEEDPPSAEKILSSPNWTQLRASMEHHALISLPFDEFFAPLEKELGTKISADVDSEDDEDDFPESWGGKAKDKDPPPKTEKEKPTTSKRATKPKDVPLVACDSCKKPMPETDLVCGHCGAEYEDRGGGEVVLVKHGNAQL